MRREQREAELLKLGWKGIKAIAEPIGIEKPAGGWEEAIPRILDAEFSSDSEPEKASGKVQPSQKEAIPETTYPTVFFKQSGIPYCESCGASYQNDLDGAPVCPVASPTCDRLK